MLRQPFCVLSILCALLVTGCAGQKPVLYPNPVLQQRGQAAGHAAIRGVFSRPGPAASITPAAGSFGARSKAVRRVARWPAPCMAVPPAGQSPGPPVVPPGWSAACLAAPPQRRCIEPM